MKTERSVSTAETAGLERVGGGGSWVEIRAVGRC